MIGFLDRLKRNRISLAVIVLASCVVAGCATNGKSTSNETVSLGQIASKEAGPGSKQVVVSTQVGKGVPYVLGNSVDEQRAMVLWKDSPSTNYPTHNEVYPLGGTKWRISSLKPEGRMAAYKNVTLEFSTNGRVITTAERIDGKTVKVDECYRVIGDTLAVSRGGYVSNWKIKFQPKQLIAETGGVRATLDKAP